MTAVRTFAPGSLFKEQLLTMFAAQLAAGQPLEEAEGFAKLDLGRVEHNTGQMFHGATGNPLEDAFADLAARVRHQGAFLRPLMSPELVAANEALPLRFHWYGGLITSIGAEMTVCIRRSRRPVVYNPPWTKPQA